MLALSQFLARLCRARPQDHQFLMSLHAYRYAHFVQTSPRGRHCRYAQATARLYLQDEEEKKIRKYSQDLPPVLRTQLQELL